MVKGIGAGDDFGVGGAEAEVAGAEEAVEFGDEGGGEEAVVVGGAQRVGAPTGGDVGLVGRGDASAEVEVEAAVGGDVVGAALGEAETIVLGKEIDAERLVMDDLDARRFAHRVGLELIGTLGLLLAARLDGRIASLQREIENLEGAGFRVAPKLVERLLMEAGEGTA